MARGDCESAFAATAAADGVPLVRAREPWLNQRGHLGLPSAASGVVDALAVIFERLGGVEVEQAGKRPVSLPGDFVHAETGVFVEVDEHQHFTSWRLASLDLYPDDAPLGFDRDEYRELCRTWSPRSDRYRASKGAVGFGLGGRQRQRAYHDALRDLATPAMGHAPLIRAAVPDRDGAAAYARVRARLRSAVGSR